MSGLVELVSRGEQDRHLIERPEISFWRQNYRRYTNFSMKPERLDFIGTFGANQEVTIPIKSKGDLLNYVWIEYPEVGSARANVTKGLHARNAAPTEFSLDRWPESGGNGLALHSGGPQCPLPRRRRSCSVTTNDVLENAKGTNGNADHYVIPFFFSKDWTKCLPLSPCNTQTSKSESSVDRAQHRCGCHAESVRELRIPRHRRARVLHEG